MSFTTLQISPTPDVIAPDGSEVRVLCRTDRGSMAHFTLPAGAVAKAVTHRTIDEIWYVLSGRGRMWRRDESGREEVVELRAGVSLTIPQGTHFQFRADDTPLTAIGTAMPPWASDDEAYAVEGPWPPTV